MIHSLDLLDMNFPNKGEGNDEMSQKVFTIASGQVEEGATVEKLTLSGAGTTIPAILIGEDGRGRARGVLTVKLTPALQAEWEAKGQCTLLAAVTGQSKAGKPILIARDEATDDSQIVVVFRTQIGFRGGNNHSGDSTGRWQVYVNSSLYDKRDLSYAEAVAHCREHGLEETRIKPDKHLPFPGEMLVEGAIAQGQAGGMGSGAQLVAILPRDTWFRTSYSGRLYGSPAAHYYRWDGTQLVSMTLDERLALDAFDLAE